MSNYETIYPLNQTNKNPNNPQNNLQITRNNRRNKNSISNIFEPGQVIEKNPNSKLRRNITLSESLTPMHTDNEKGQMLELYVMCSFARIQNLGYKPSTNRIPTYIKQAMQPVTHKETFQDPKRVRSTNGFAPPTPAR